MKYLCLFVALIMSSCAALNQDGDRPDLGDIKWTLFAIGQKNYNMGDKTIIRFDTKDREVEGKAACNNFSAGYEMFSDNRINFVDITSTKMYCEGVMNIENQMLTNLKKVKRYEIKADKLYLYGEAELLLTFKR